ncbi:hypothetical protein ACFQ3Z_07270 [Streptomyces nogalater]
MFGVRITQDADPLVIGPGTLAEGTEGGPPPTVRQLRDAVLGLITVRYTQSNSVACVHDGRTIGIGAGQQSRVDCVRLAGEKADRWRLRRHPLLARARFPGTLSIQDRVNSVLRLIEESPAPCPTRAAGPRSARHAAGSRREGRLAGRAHAVHPRLRRLPALP